jgi:hypothetical protein
MYSDSFMRYNSASPRATSWIVAAIVLVLNWTAPGQFQFDPFQRNSDPTPGMSSATWAHPGTLPRVQQSSTTCEAKIQRPPSSRSSASGKSKSHAVPATPVVPHACRAPLVRNAQHTDAPSIAPRVFNARAPPAVTA